MQAALKAIAEPRRRAILRLVSDTELPVGSIAVHFDISRPAISQHLSVLRGAGLVSVPLMALAAFAVFLSATTHNSVGSGVGAVVLVLLLRLASGLGLSGPLDPYLLTNQFEAWLNLARDPISWEPIARSLWVSLLWGTCFLAAAWAVFIRRDVLS